MLLTAGVDPGEGGHIGIVWGEGSGRPGQGRGEDKDYCTVRWRGWAGEGGVKGSLHRGRCRHSALVLLVALLLTALPCNFWDIQEGKAEYVMLNC